MAGCGCVYSEHSGNLKSECPAHAAIRQRAEQAELSIKHLQSAKDGYRAQLNATLAAHGYNPGELQHRWRHTKGLTADASWCELDCAVLDALVNEGGATAWHGDGSSCAAQIIDNVLRERDEARAKVERLEDALKEIVTREKKTLPHYATSTVLDLARAALEDK